MNGQTMNLEFFYLAHSYGGSRVKRARAVLWAGWLSANFYAVAIAPWLTLTEVWTEENRDLGLQIDRAVIDHYGLPLLAVGGEWSSGMERERERAHHVFDLTYLGVEPPDLTPEIIARLPSYLRRLVRPEAERAKHRAGFKP